MKRARRDDARERAQFKRGKSERAQQSVHGNGGTGLTDFKLQLSKVLHHDVAALDRSWARHLAAEGWVGGGEREQRATVGGRASTKQATTRQGRAPSTHASMRMPQGWPFGTSCQSP
jgi:hypothetical protein